MNSHLLEFVRRFPDFAALSHADKIPILGHFIQEVLGYKFFDAKSLDEAYKALDLVRPKNFADLLLKMASKGAIVKANGGYRLSRKTQELISSQLGNPVLVTLSAQLAQLPSLLKGSERAFLEEAINCLKIKAWRAAIVLSWILTMDHMEEYVLRANPSSFNQVLSRNPRYSRTNIRQRSDFEDIKEADFIVTMRSAGLITNDQRKILEEKLGIRNSCAHPSGVVVTESKVASFLEDLVYNILTKLQIP